MVNQPQFVEALEPRRLLAGVTMLTHGWNGSITQWIATAAADITTDLGGPAQAPQYILTLNLNTTSGALIPSVTHVAGSGTPQTSTSGQIILILDWESVSTNAGYSLAGIAGVFTNYMLNNPIGGVNVTQLPIHEISQSRGVGMDDAIAQSLGQAGVWVEQETDLDPHTIGVMNDPPPTLYSNVEFADVYWRSDGNPADDATNGQPVAGAYNLNIYWLDGDSAGYTSVHDATTGYYVGTIDTTGTWGGDGPIISNWYGDTPTMPARTATGFYYSAIDGGARPVSGLWAASGGTGTRTATGQSGQQWPNVSDLATTNGSTFASGNSIDLKYIQQDRGDTDTITYYLDSDENPYDGTGIEIGSQTGIAASGSINSGKFNAALSGVAPGNYYVCAEVANAAGLVRYDYTQQKVTIAGATTSGGGALTGSSVAAESSYNLTASGTSDWAHWGAGGNSAAFDHDATGGSQISNVTKVGSGSYGGYADPSRNVSWTNGSPLASDVSDSGYIWANNAIGAGYSFTVPASTTPRTLYVYLGGFSSGSTLTAHLSDGSAADYVVNLSGTGLYADVVAINYNAASAGQTLTITYVKSQTIGSASGSTDLIAAWLGGGGAPVMGTAPSVWTGPTSTAAAAGSTLTFTASANGNPAPTVQWQISTNNGASYAAIPGATSLAYSFVAAASENGDLYRADFTNSAGSAITLPASLTVTGGTSGSSGLLSGVQSTAASSYNLTTLGTSDWAHWGLGGSVSAFDHKATGNSQISGVTRLGAGSYGGYSDPSRKVTWNDGSPLAKESGDSGYIWANNAIGAGYSFTVPASTTTQTLYVYLGGYSSGSTLTAQLSDGSAPNYVANLSGSGLYADIVAITYKAASAGQTLKISYVKSQTINAASGSSDLIAAWLI